jgi:hypothetical protein
MENNDIILNEKRICSKINLFLNISFLLFNIFGIFIGFEYIEKNRLFYYYCITLFTIFFSTSNNTYREYIYYKNYGRIFSSVEEYEIWKKQNKNYGKYFLKCIEYISLIFYLFNSLPIKLNIQDNDNNNLIFYKINIFLLQILTIFIMLIIAIYIIFLACMIFSYPMCTTKSTVIKEIKEIKEIIVIKIDNLNEECSICLDKNEKIWIKTHCNHLYHNECINEWMEINKSCPICREQL